MVAERNFRLRQLVIAAETRDVISTVQHVLHLGKPFVDPGVAEFGLTNAVFALGDQFLEVVIPQTETAPARRFINTFGVGGYMAIFQVPSIRVVRDRADKMGLRRVWNIDLPDIAASHIHPSDIGAAIVSVDEPRPPPTWRWGGPDWSFNSVPGRLTGLTVSAQDPVSVGKRWISLLCGEACKEAFELETANATVSFDKGAHTGLSQFIIEIPDAEAALRRAEASGLDRTSAGFMIGTLEIVLPRNAG